MPSQPHTTLGMPTKTSIAGCVMVLAQRGAISDMKIARPDRQRRRDDRRHDRDAERAGDERQDAERRRALLGFQFVLRWLTGELPRN